MKSLHGSIRPTPICVQRRTRRFLENAILLRRRELPARTFATSQSDPPRSPAADSPPPAAFHHPQEILRRHHGHLKWQKARVSSKNFLRVVKHSRWWICRRGSWGSDRGVALFPPAVRRRKEVRDILRNRRVRHQRRWVRTNKSCRDFMFHFNVRHGAAAGYRGAVRVQ